MWFIWGDQINFNAGDDFSKVWSITAMENSLNVDILGKIKIFVCSNIM